MSGDFDTLYQVADPFGYATRWYEQRKRDLLLAMLPRRHFNRAWEPGCSTGVLTRRLAQRCGWVLGTDASARAIAQANAGEVPANVTFAACVQPQQWPDGRFDLIVFSEVGYYLDTAALPATARRLAGSLAPDGGLLACHWRHPFAQRRHSAEQVHAALAEALGTAPAQHYEDADILVQGWWPGPGVGEREGLA